MSRNTGRSTKSEDRIDYTGGAGWRNDKPLYPEIIEEYHGMTVENQEIIEEKMLEKFKNYLQEEVKKYPKTFKAFKKIQGYPDFVDAVYNLTRHYKARETPRPPEPKEGMNIEELKALKREYKNRLQPTVADIKRSLENLEKSDNRVEQLSKKPRTHPIFKAMGNAWYEEHKELLEHSYFDRMRDVEDFYYMLETTPMDHPQWTAMQDIWDKEHKTDFEYLNNVFIPSLIKISLKHLKQHPQEVYLFETSDNITHKIWLAWRLGVVFNRFGLKVSCTKDGPLAECLRILLAAAGHPYETTWHPYETTHKLITKPVLDELKKSRP